MFILSSLEEWRLGKEEEEGWMRRSHHPECSRPRKAWKPGFVQRRKSEGNIFLTWMFLNLISKRSAPQRAVCLSLAKHNITLHSLSLSLLVNRATICGGRAGFWQLIPVTVWKCLVFQASVGHMCLAALTLSLWLYSVFSSFSYQPS